VITRLRQRRLVAVLGDIEALKPRLWLEAVRQGLSTAPQVVWLSDGARGLWRGVGGEVGGGGGGRGPGWTAAPPGRVGGLAGHGTGCGMASQTGSWPTWSRPWRSRACLTPHGIR